MAKVTVSFEAKRANRRLGEIEQRGKDMIPLYQNIGEYMVGSIEDRFQRSQAPDGKKWKKNKDSTMANYLGKSKGKKREKRAGNKRPLIGAGGFSSGLAGQVNYTVTLNGVDIGSNKPYAAMMHFGGKKAVYTHLWGDIPARPWLGASEADEEEIINLGTDHLMRPF